MSAPVNSSQSSADSVSLADFRRMAKRAKNRPLEISQGKILASPAEGHGFSAKAHKLFRGIAESLKLLSRQERVDAEERRARQILAVKRFQSLMSAQGLPLSERDDLLAKDAVLTGRRALEIMSAADAERPARQGDAAHPAAREAESKPPAGLAAKDAKTKAGQKKTADERPQTGRKSDEAGTSRLSRDKTEHGLKKKAKKRAKEMARPAAARKMRAAVKGAVSKKARRKKGAEKFIRHYEVHSDAGSGRQPYAAAGRAPQSAAKHDAAETAVHTPP